MLHAKTARIREVTEAARVGDLDKIKLLASLGVKVDDVIVAKVGFGGISVAASTGQVDVVKYFLDNYHYSNADKKMVLEIAAEHGQVNVIRLLIEQYAIFSKRAIHSTIEENHLEAMKCMLDFDPRYLYAEEIGGYVPLQTAVGRGKLPIVRELLENYKVNPDKHGSNSTTAWGIAVIEGQDISLLQPLLQYGADINQTIDTSSQTQAIHYVLEMRHSLEIAEFLASSGADMKVRDKFGNTLLHFLMTNGMRHINSPESLMRKIQFLVEYGVDPQEKNAHDQQAKSLLKEVSKITPEQFDISAAIGLKTIQKNKRIIAITIERELPQLPKVLPLLIADYVGGYGRAFGTSHLPDAAVALEESKKDHNEEENNEASSSSNAQDFPPGGGGIKASSSSQDKPSDEHQSMESDQPSPTSSTVEQYSYTEIAKEPEEALLMKLFTWIQDLPEALQKKILGLFAELLATLEQYDNFITSQLDIKPVEELFDLDSKNYYEQNYFMDGSEDYATISQSDSLAAFSDDTMVISSDGMLIDPLPKQDFHFDTLHLLANIAS